MLTTKEKLLAHIASLPLRRRSAADLAKALRLSPGGVTAALQWLVAAGQLEVVERQLGPGGGTTYRHVRGFPGLAHPSHTVAS